MDLRIKDVAELLHVSIPTVEKWLAAGAIPAYRIEDEVWFNRNEIENWVLSHNEEAESSYTHEPSSKSGGTKQYSLYRAINNGGVLVSVRGKNKEEVIRNAIHQGIAKKLDLDPEGMTALLLERENLHTTALGKGIAIPHTRDFLLPGHRDVVAVAYPEVPTDFDALDQEPVNILFFLFACDDKRHLHLLAKIAHLCNTPNARAFFKTKPDEKALLTFIKEWESSLKTAETTS